jgi:hypothetical protein
VITGGVRIEGSRLVTFDGFDIRSSLADSQAAAQVSDSVGAAFVLCKFPGNDFGGVDAQDTFEVVVNGCEFAGMDEDSQGGGGFGVRIRGQRGHRVLASKFGSDEGRSIWIEADRAEVSNNSLSGADGDCAILVDGLANVVKKNSVKNAEHDGIRVGGTAEVNDCTVSNCGGIGIRIGIDDSESFHGSVVKNCDVSDNENHGVLIDAGQDGAEVRACDLDENGGAGIRVKADRCVIRDNEVTGTNGGGAGGHGVLVDGTSDGNTIRANTFKSNSGQAIVVEGDDCYVFLNVATDTDSFLNSGSDNAGRDNKTKGSNQFD